MNTSIVGRNCIISGVENLEFTPTFVSGKLATELHELMLLEADKVFLSKVEVTGWNTRVHFGVLETFLKRVYKLPAIGTLGFVDFKNEEYNVPSSDLEYFRPLSK